MSRKKSEISSLQSVTQQLNRRVSTWWNTGPLVSNDKSWALPSETSPGQALSVKEILDRHSRGLDVPANAGYYFHDEEVPDPRYLSRIDYMDWVRDFNLEYARRVKDAEEAEAAGQPYVKPDLPPDYETIQDIQSEKVTPAPPPRDPDRTPVNKPDRPSNSE